MANPIIPCSQRGVLKTLSVPYFWLRSREQRKTPPNLTSSPKVDTLEVKGKINYFGSISMFWSMAFLMAVNILICSKSPKEFLASWAVRKEGIVEKDALCKLRSNIID